MNKPLFERIGDIIRRAEISVKLGASVHESTNGSISQVLWVERDVQAEDNFNRIEQYNEREIRVCSNTQHDKRIAIETLTTSFKVQKDQILNRRPYSCYDF
jgi:hypothetical protein